MNDTDRITLDVRSEIAWSDETAVTVLGRDLSRDIIGHLDLGSFAFLLLTERTPSHEEAVLFNAALVSLVEHGITPSAMATRLTYLGAPESLQSAVAAGLLGLGTRFVGTIEGAARLLIEGTERLADAPGEVAVRVEAERAVDELRAKGEHIPGIGHPIHKPADPRAERLLDFAGELGFSTVPVQLMRAVSAEASKKFERDLPVNVTGAIGVAVMLLDVDWRIARGLGVIARTVGLVGHLREELAEPMANTLWRTTDAAATRHLSNNGSGS